MLIIQTQSRWININWFWFWSVGPRPMRYIQQTHIYLWLDVMFIICHVNPWRWRFKIGLLCHTHMVVSGPHNDSTCAFSTFCLTDLYLKELNLNQFNYGFATHDSVSTTGNNHTWFWPTFKAFRPTKYAVVWADDAILDTTSRQK